MSVSIQDTLDKYRDLAVVVTGFDHGSIMERAVGELFTALEEANQEIANLFNQLEEVTPREREI